jgi:glycosyltransferase involved in cell wall biosynthesis
LKKLVALPFYNKKSIILSSLSKLYKYLDKDTEVLLIDDGSTDGSQEVTVNEPAIRYIKHDKSLGYGGCFISALHYGFENKMDLLYFLDFPYDEFHKAFLLMSQFKENYDILNTSRIDDTKKTQFNKDDYQNLYLSNQISSKINSLTKFNLNDIFSPFKAIRLDTIKQMTLEEFDEAIIIQLYIQAAHFKLQVKEFFCNDICIEVFDENNSFENDTEYYLNFIEGEKIIYPI